MLDLGLELKEIRKKLGKTQVQIAQDFGIPQTTWASYESGKAAPPMKILFALAEQGYPIKGLTTNVVQDMINDKKISKAEFHRRIEIAKAFPPDMSLDDFNKITEKSKNSSGVFFVPLLDQKLSAGKGSNLPETDTPKIVIPAPSYLSHYGENVAALSVDGDSMEPTLSRGDMVICDSCGWSGEGIYAIQMDGCGLVKRLSRKPGRFVIQSDNPKYQSFEESAESESIRIVGRVHCILKNAD